MLEETDIIEDWTMIKKAVKQKQQFQRRGHVVRSGTLNYSIVEDLNQSFCLQRQQCIGLHILTY